MENQPSRCARRKARWIFTAVLLGIALEQKQAKCSPTRVTRIHSGHPVKKKNVSSFIEKQFKYHKVHSFKVYGQWF